jgi:hypothetical protein
VLAVLRLSLAGSSIPELAEMTGLHPYRVHVSLRQMRRDGAAAKVGRRDELRHHLWRAP